jgi:hypothetical protein
VYFGKEGKLVPLASSPASTSAPSRTYSNDYISVSVVYPVIPGKSEDIVETNAVLKKAIDAQIDEFDVSTKENDMFHIDTIKSMVQGGYAVEASTGDWVSIVGGLSFYSSGAAHPFFVVDTYVYDLQQKKILKLSDVFKAGSDYLSVLSKLSREDLYLQVEEGDTDNPPDTNFIFSGTEPNEENFRSFAFLCEGLALYFGEYQVAPYAAGVQHVVIPYSKLKPYLHDRISGYTCINS